MTRLHGTKDFWIAALRTEGPAFRDALAGAAPDSAVPSCPDWTSRDLVHHLGSVYQWVGGILNSPTTDPPPSFALADESPEGSAAVEWWQHEFDQLMVTLDGIDPGSPSWNWAFQPKQAAFWHRRMAHETAVHRWDAQLAAGTPHPIEAKLAADGVSEALDTWLPGGRRREFKSRYGVVHLAATDTSQEWFVRLRGEGVALLDTDTILDSGDHHARVHATGPASDLLLALWGRLGFDTLDVTGDATLLGALRVG